MPKPLLRLWDEQGRKGAYIDLPVGDYPKLSSDEMGRFQDRAAFFEVISDSDAQTRIPSGAAAAYASSTTLTDEDMADVLNVSNNDRVAVTLYDYDNFRIEGLGTLSFKSPIIALPNEWQDNVASVKFRIAPYPPARAAAAAAAREKAARDAAAAARAADAAVRKARAAAAPIRPIEFSIINGSAINVLDPKTEPAAFPADFREVSDGAKPGDLGLPKPLVAYQPDTGMYAPAVEEYQSVRAAAIAGDPGARAALGAVGINN